MQNLSQRMAAPPASPQAAGPPANGPRSPATSRRRLRTGLRRRREDLRHTLDTVSTAMQWSPSKISRIETGAVTITVNDLTALLRFYQLTDAPTVQQLLHLARLSRKPHWTGAYRSLIPRPYLDFLGYEDDARRIRAFHPTAITDLAQTNDYTRALNTALGRPPSQIDGLAALHSIRRRHVFDRPDAAAIQVIIPEPVLGPMSIGRPAVMFAQIDHLLELDTHPNIELIITAEPAGHHRGDSAAFTVLECADTDAGADDPDVVYIADGNDDPLLDNPTDVSHYQQVFEQMAAQGTRGPAAHDVLQSWRAHFAAAVLTAPDTDG
jgi:hypothetical protein